MEITLNDFSNENSGNSTSAEISSKQPHQKKKVLQIPNLRVDKAAMFEMEQLRIKSQM
jgi:hypothetical protein